MTKPIHQQPQPPAEQERYEPERSEQQAHDALVDLLHEVEYAARHLETIPARVRTAAVKARNYRPWSDQLVERCPTCGAGDSHFDISTSLVRVLRSDQKYADLLCPDPFHQQKGGGADERSGAEDEERSRPFTDATSGPDSKPLSEDEGRDSSQDEEREERCICAWGNDEPKRVRPYVVAANCPIHGFDSERGEQRWTAVDAGTRSGRVKHLKGPVIEHGTELVPATQADQPWKASYFWMREQRDQLRQERDELQRFAFGDRPEWEQANATLKHAVRAAEADLVQLRGELQNAWRSAADLEDAQAAEETRADQAEDQVAQLQERVRELEEALRSLLDSLSWDAVEYEHWTVDDDPVQEAKAALTAQEQGEADG